MSTATADWVVSKIEATGDGFYGLRVTGINLNHAEGAPDRHFTWQVPVESIANPRYDLFAADVAEPLRRLVATIRPEVRCAKGLVAFDDGPTLEAWIWPEHWNGYSMPLLPRASVEAMIAWLNPESDYTYRLLDNGDLQTCGYGEDGTIGVIETHPPLPCGLYDFRHESMCFQTVACEECGGHEGAMTRVDNDLGDFLLCAGCCAEERGAS